VAGAALRAEHDVVGRRRDTRAAGQAQLAAATVALYHEPLRPFELGVEAARLPRDAAMVARAQSVMLLAVGPVLMAGTAGPGTAARWCPGHRSGRLTERLIGSARTVRCRRSSLVDAGAASPDGICAPLTFQRQPTLNAVTLDRRRSLHDLMAPLAFDDSCSEPTT